MIADLELVYETFFNPGEVVEIRGVGFTKTGPWSGFATKTVAGYFDNAVDFALAAKQLDDFESDEDRNIYFTVNPCNPALLARANNRLKVAQVTTKDENILCYRWLYIDTDPKRPTGISATDEELKAAIECRDRVVAWLIKQGFPEPITALSGNGGHAHFRLPDLPNTPETTNKIKHILQAINARFGNGLVKVDEANHNASRVAKLYGTVARKGDSVGPYKHRRSFLETGGHPVSTY